jgi:hypothetical protein
LLSLSNFADHTWGCGGPTGKISFPPTQGSSKAGWLWGPLALGSNLGFLLLLWALVQVTLSLLRKLVLQQEIREEEEDRFHSDDGDLMARHRVLLALDPGLRVAGSSSESRKEGRAGVCWVLTSPRGTSAAKQWSDMQGPPGG